MNQKIVAIINSKILEQLEKGVVVWKQTWTGTSATNLVSKKPYKGINRWFLNSFNFPSPYFVSFKQAKQLGGNVKRGERGLPVVFWKIQKTKKVVDGVEVEDTFPLLRYYTVFNVSQCEGLDSKIPKGEVKDNCPLLECENIINAYIKREEITYNLGGDRAFYVPSLDSVNVPTLSSFVSSEAFYSVNFHEIVHSTGHSRRLNRSGVTNVQSFASHEYSKEELIAEFGASYLCGVAGIENQTIENSGAYISHWLRVLKESDNKEWLISAGSQAEKSVTFILEGRGESLDGGEAESEGDEN